MLREERIPNTATEAPHATVSLPHRPTSAQRQWLRRGLEQPGGKLPLFDRDGKRVSTLMVRGCLEAGWASPWFANPLKPDWLVCRLTDAGRRAVEG